MKKSLILVLFIAATVLPTYAGHIKEGTLLCTSLKAFKQMRIAVKNKDDRGVHYLLNDDCFFLKKGLNLEASEIDGWKDLTKVRLYAPSGNTIEVWTSDFLFSK